MPVMIITYDIQDNDRRNAVRERIEAMQSEDEMRLMLSQSAYVVAINQPEDSMFESLKSLTDSGDKLSVLAIAAPGFALPSAVQAKLRILLGQR